MKFQNLIFSFMIIGLLAGCKSEPKLADGYEYEFTQDVEGETPQPGDYVSFSMTIRGDDNSILEELKEGPTMPVLRIPKEDEPDQKPNPIITVLKMASEGDSVTVKMPIDSIQQAPANIANMEYVTYNMYVVDIQSEVDYNAEREAERLAMEAEADALKERMSEVEETTLNAVKEIQQGGANVQTDASGIRYIVHEEGSGDQMATGDVASIAYHGILPDGSLFDSSFKSGRKFTFNIGRGEAIKGWDVGIPLLKEGSKATLYIPYDLAYGEAGRPPQIPEKADLVFYVEVDKAE